MGRGEASGATRDRQRLGVEAIGLGLVDARVAVG
jgi:hypothetical protein